MAWFTLIRTVDPILAEEVQFLEFLLANPIVRKAAPLIISSESNLAEELTVAVDTMKRS